MKINTFIHKVWGSLGRLTSGHLDTPPTRWRWLAMAFLQWVVWAQKIHGLSWSQMNERKHIYQSQPRCFYYILLVWPTMRLSWGKGSELNCGKAIAIEGHGQRRELGSVLERRFLHFTSWKFLKCIWFDKACISFFWLFLKPLIVCLN